ncbi:hypothetical protein KFE98_08125 [bacterium SCSIO 12741]|nr:hypothetical protein KFE98_08125 [bacterium SCSIO 12741]
MKFRISSGALEKILLMLKIVILLKTIVLMIAGSIIWYRLHLKKMIQKDRQEKEKPALKSNSSLNQTQKVYGIDIAKYRLKELEDLSPEDSISFVYLKATDGLGYSNPNLYSEWKTAVKKNLVYGAYHFFRNHDDGQKQAEFFYEQIKPIYKSASMPLVLDVETASITHYPFDENVKNNVKLFLNRLEKLTQTKPMIYTNYYFGEAYLTDSNFAQYPLWVADYTSQKEPRVPAVWKRKGWSVWQKTNTYEQHNDLDLAQPAFYEIHR